MIQLNGEQQSVLNAMMARHNVVRSKHHASSSLASEKWYNSTRQSERKGR